MLGDLHLYHLIYSKDTVWLSERGSQLQNILSAMNEVHAKFELGINLGKKSLQLLSDNMVVQIVD